MCDNGSDSSVVIVEQDCPRCKVGVMRYINQRPEDRPELYIHGR